VVSPRPGKFFVRGDKPEKPGDGGNKLTDGTSVVAERMKKGERRMEGLDPKAAKGKGGRRRGRIFDLSLRESERNDWEKRDEELWRETVGERVQKGGEPMRPFSSKGGTKTKIGGRSAREEFRREGDI